VEVCDLADLRVMISLATRRVTPQRLTIVGILPETYMILHILGWDATPRVTVLSRGDPAESSSP
jgi:hypothetical protein